jgi:hypothetical protein
MRSLALICLCLAALGCVAIPVESTPTGKCRRQAEPCRSHLVIGFFPAVGEAHLNDRATNGESLSAGLRLADYTLRPLYIMAINFLSLGFPTLSDWLLEPYEPYDTDPGRCDKALLGYCKAAEQAQGDADPVPSGKDADRS